MAQAANQRRQGVRPSGLEPIQDASSARSRTTAQLPPRAGKNSQQSWARSELDLADWLELSWFYPQGFEKQEVRETRFAYVVLGESVVYKFLKPTPRSSQAVHDASFPEIWRRVCLEIKRNRELAPELFLGVRLLRTIDNEPHWITELRSSELNPEEPPLNADQAAIVMRRIPEGHRLSEILLEEDELTHEQVAEIAKRLVRFHKRKQRDGRRMFFERERDIIQVSEDSASLGLERFSKIYGNLIDPFSQSALTQARGFLNATRSKYFEHFYERAQKGFVVPCHGALRAEHITVHPLLEEARAVSFFGRSAERGEVLEDLLFDLASLSADLEVQGHGGLAREIEAQYFNAFPEVVDDILFRYYLTAASVCRARELFESGDAKDFARANKFLAFALRVSLDLRDPFLIGVGGSFSDARYGVSQNLVDFLDGVRLTEQPLENQEILEAPFASDVRFDRLLRAAELALAEGKVVVLDASLHRAEQRIACSRLAEKYARRHLLLKCTISAEEKVEHALQSLRAIGVPILDPGKATAADTSAWPSSRVMKINQILLEPSLLQPDLSLFILRELASHI